MTLPVDCPSCTNSLREQLVGTGPDIYHIAAEAIERGDRLAAYVDILEKRIRNLDML